ncbi:MAG: sodium:calcium antiporter [bacterium]
MAWTLASIVATGILWYGAGMLEQSSERLSVHYGLPDAVRGTMIVAIGSSFPELSTVVLSTLLHGDFELGVSAIVGSAIFNILMIPALSGIYSRRSMDFSRNFLYQEAQFYLLAIAVVFLTFSFSVIYSPDMIGTGGQIIGLLSRPLALIPITLYGIYVFIQYQDATDYDQPVHDEVIRGLKEWGKLLIGLLLILVGVEVLLRAVIRLGNFLNTPSFLWGVTVVAVSTSLPDTMASVRLAGDGYPVTSIANVFGSNVFDLLVCIPAGVLIAGATTVNFSIAVPLFVALTIGTFVLFLLIRTNMVLSVGECWGLLGVYGFFVVWIVLESLGTINSLATLP